MTDSTVLDDRVARADDSGPSGNATSRGGRQWSEAVLIARDLAIVVVATLVPLVVVFRLWDGGLGNPFTYFGDSHFYGGVAQNIIQTGWYQHTDRLGAPTGQQMYDFPLGGDNFWWLVMRVMALFTSDWALLVNLFYLLGFVLSAVSAFFVLRWLGGHRVTSTAAAVLYAFAPYHFIRGTNHLVYASYAVVPIGVVLAVRVARGRHPFSGVRAAASRRWLPIVGWVVAAALVGSCNSYYAVFSAILIATAALASAVAARSWRPVLAGAVTILLIGAVLGVNLLPSILYSREHGKNEVAQRQAQEVDIYGLRFVQMLTPIPEHRVAPLRTLSDDLLKGPYNSEASMFLGIVAGVGLLGMIGSLLVRAVRPRRVAPHDDDDEADGADEDVRPMLGVMTIVAILIATIGGLAWFFALAGATEVRGWNRISIVIAFLALAWLVLTVDRLLAGHLRDRVGGQSWPSVRSSSSWRGSRTRRRRRSSRIGARTPPSSTPTVSTSVRSNPGCRAARPSSSCRTCRIPRAAPT